MIEDWRQLKGFENYEISNFGVIRNIIKKNTLKIYQDKAGYQSVLLNRRRVLIHRAVFESFVDEIAKGFQIHHIDEDKSNNKLSNLQILSQKDHQAHHKTKHPKTKLCVVCKNAFTPHPTKRLRAQTCSLACFDILRININKAKRKKVGKYKNGVLIEVYDSQMLAAQSADGYSSNISKCIKGKIPSAYGYQWQLI